MATGENGGGERARRRSTGGFSTGTIGLVARNHFHALPGFSGNVRPDTLAQIQEFLPITGLRRVATDLVRQRRDDLPPTGAHDDAARCLLLSVSPMHW